MRAQQTLERRDVSRSVSADILAASRAGLRPRQESRPLVSIDLPGFRGWRRTCPLLFVKKIQTNELEGQLVLQVAGGLAGAFVSELEGRWQAARAKTPNRKISVDLKRVTRIDQAGWRLLQSMHSSGVDFLRAALAMNKLWSSRRNEALHA
jgi:hypothetical protein